MKRGTRLAAAGAALLAAGWGGADGAEEPLQERLEQLERRQTALEQRLEAASQAAPATITANARDGFSIRSADKAFALKLWGYVQADGRAFLNDDGRALADQFLLRRVRTTFDGTVSERAEFRVQPDFGGGTVTLWDAYLDLAYEPRARLRAGKFKTPFGLERLQSSHQTPFVEAAHTTSLTPNYDVGLQVHGEMWGGILGYALGIFNGAADGGSSDGDTSDNKDFAARVFAHPFRNGPAAALKELGLGAAATAGKHKGTTASPGLASYKSPGQNTFFSYRSDVVADGDRVRFSPQAYWYPGRLGFLGEYVASAQEVKSTTTVTRDTLTHRAWQAAVYFVLTGENASYKGVKPKAVFDPGQGTWGAWELAARYHELTLDPDAFLRYADPAKSAQRARSWTGGLNWYVNANVKFGLSHTGGAAGGPRPLERAVLGRLQVVF